MSNFHLMEVILISKKISSKLCKLLFLPHLCNVNKQDFFSPMKDQIIQILKKKWCFMIIEVMIDATKLSMVFFMYFVMTILSPTTNFGVTKLTLC
jgi:hypothetical protein